MQRILGLMRKAANNFEMLSDGDRIAVGVSGGKDSLVLLYGLARLRDFIGIDYKVIAVTIDPQFGGKSADHSGISELCRELGVRYEIIPTQIGEIVFDVRKEPNPCSLCSRMRRGALLGAVKDLGCNKLALGHNKDDAVETFMMNLTLEGRIGCFPPICTLDDKDITLIRPLVLAEEKEIRTAAARAKLPVLKSACPADGKTAREKTKKLIASLESTSKGTKERIFGAILRSGLDGWHEVH
ncbi:MAG: tRNA 2-thiocytidine biosynthesis TtcA family protein [Oscillospiraceae bacterium]